MVTNRATSSSSSARRSKALVAHESEAPIHKTRRQHLIAHTMIKIYSPERVFSSTTERTSVSLKSSGAAVVLALNTNVFGTWTCMAYRLGSCPAKNRAQR